MGSHRYTDQEVERGLTALALASGNSKRAEAALAETGLKVSAATLRGWKTRTYPKQYATVREEILPAIREQLAEQHTELAGSLANLATKISARLEENYDKLEPRDLPGALRNVATSSAIHTDKASQLRQEPTSVIVHDHGYAIAQLRRKGLVVDGTAVEIPQPRELEAAGQ